MTRNPNESNKQFQSSFRTKRSKKIKKTRKSSASSDKYLIAVRSRESYAPLKPTAYSILNARKEFLRSSHTKSDQNEMELCFPNTGICRLRKFQPKTLTFSSQLSMQRPQEPSFEQERNVKKRTKKRKKPTNPTRGDSNQQWRRPLSATIEDDAISVDKDCHRSSRCNSIHEPTKISSE